MTAKIPDHPNTAQAQRQRLLEALRRGTVTTLEARRDLDVMHPGGRILELRREGYNITTFWTYEPTDGGRLHRVGRYALLAEAKPGVRHG